jgi:hypothetical protein
MSAGAAPPTPPSQPPPTPQEAMSPLWWMTRKVYRGETRTQLKQMVALFGGLAVFCMTACAVAQSVAIGFGSALALYWISWIAVPIVMVLTPLSILLTAPLFDLLLMAAFGPLLLAKRIGPRAIRRVGEVYLAIVVLGGAALIGSLGYHGARDRVSPPASTDPAVANQIRTAMSEQKASVETVSERGKKLLGELDKTAGEFAQARENLRTTLAQADAQRLEIANAQGEVDTLIEQGRFNRIRLDQFRALLNNEEPLTRGFFNRSSWESLFIGVALGGVMSHVVSLWELLKSFRARFRP